VPPVQPGLGTVYEVTSPAVIELPGLAGLSVKIR